MNRKIAIVGAIDPGAHNAASIHVFSLARSWAKKGNKVNLFTLRTGNRTWSPENLQAIEHHVGFKSKWLCLPNALLGILLIPILLKYIIKENPDIIYIRSNLASFITVVILRLFRQRVITEHNGWFKDEVLLFKKSIFWAFLSFYSQILDARFASQVRVVTPGIKRLLVNSGIKEKKIFIQGNGTDVEQINIIPKSKARKKLNLSLEKKYLGFVGTLAKWQGVNLIIEAFIALSKKHSNLEVIIAGKGPELSDLKNKVSRAGLIDKVHFIYGDSNDATNCILSAIDIALAPFIRDRNEKIGLSPLKIRDYAAAGLPVLAAGLPGINELTGLGWLFTHIPDDVQDIVKECNKLLSLNDNTLKSIAVKARQHAIEQFSWDNVCNNMDRCIWNLGV
jgi:glycosyltransferase involved in cell wall biosynthesis